MLEAISPIKQSQESMIDTLYCLSIPYEKDYGLTKNGRKTRILKTHKYNMEFFFMDKMKLNGKVMTVYDAQRKLIRENI